MPNLLNKPHANLDLTFRQKKAKKIAQLLGIDNEKLNLKILEIGTGAGGISHYLSTLNHHVYAVDTVDNRQLSDGYHFELVKDTLLPYPDHSFDIVISNHVIEHVGPTEKQLHHLQEIKRTLKQNGKAYLAVPNRWMLIEPHYNLIFLSYLPISLRTPYLRLCKKGDYYDCLPLSLNSLETLLEKAELNFQNICVEALKVTLMIERPNSKLNRFISKIPNYILKLSNPIIPTLIYQIQHKHK